ncbi:growth-regulating factor 7-like isoform X2 [Salvia splendens]|uniref:growth-regulating factor 7-like isoform X2 n=1 Tax=Salvia splendens TaxID=180675 RepID=UPI001C265A74|nr:growth-regulating factor 7-like isoform X2 [Salvia splendens]
MYSQPLTAPIAIAPPPPPGEDKLNLDLEIGSCASANANANANAIEGGLKQVKRERLFSRDQFAELCNQICIHNSIVYGFPVAFHLLLPIWISVFHSLGPAIYIIYPTLSGFSPEKSDHSTVMDDSEPGRCRRTDGRKWRCSKNAVLLQKYCESHMHRGRQGSRKHVEPIQRVSRPINHRVPDATRMPVMSLVASDVDDRVSVSVQSDLAPSQLRCTNSADYTLSMCSSSRANCLVSGGDHGDGKSSLGDADPVNLSGRMPNVVGNNYVGFNYPRNGKVGVGLDATEGGAQRCRRTDGKKWQCRRDVLYNQKYCEAHMHRGVKRLMVKPEHSNHRGVKRLIVKPEHSKRTPAGTAQEAPRAITRNLDSGINLNTLPESPQHPTSNDSSSSASDATTITDENISYCLSNGSLHHG